MKVSRRIQLFTVASMSFVALTIGLQGCNGNGGGNGPVDPGAVSGVVQLPFQFSAAGDPIEGASVTLTTGDLDTTVVTDADGRFLFAPVPTGDARVVASLSSCLRAVRDVVAVMENDTTDLILELYTDADVDSLTIGWTNASDMEISPIGDRIILLYNAAARGGSPGIATVDIATGIVTTRDFSDADDAFDIKFVTANLVAVNYRQDDAFWMRFVDPVTLATVGDDVFYHTTTAFQHAGRMVVLPNGLDVFVTHGAREVVTKVTGYVYCVSVPQRALNDPDNDLFDLEFGFSPDLVAGALRWPFNIAYDPSRNEILVGNRDSTIVTGISLSHWGSFDRTANLSMPVDGVRHIQMRPPQVHVDQGYSVLEWAFDGGVGVSMAETAGSRSAILRYITGETSSDLFFLDTISNPESSNHVLRVSAERNSWFSVFWDKDRDFRGNKVAVEERSLVTLERTYRYESQYLDIDQPTPSAYALDQDAGLLYVAYRERDWLEVFCLPD